ncbi:MAG: autotransporter outer membrane beta-barrel domain-containing protein, partial [Cohaesibacteraceae bacterium]|nr:autotransporter outer membrane beta-barrel domain-containing protein [Cohaesibacteraceae bacterium]
MYSFNSKIDILCSRSVGKPGYAIAVFILWSFSIFGGLIAGAETVEAGAASCTVSGTDAYVIVEDDGGTLKCTTTNSTGSTQSNKFVIHISFDSYRLSLRDALGTNNATAPNTCTANPSPPAGTTIFGVFCDVDDIVENSTVVSFSAASLSVFGTLSFTHLPGTGADSVGTITTTAGGASAAAAGATESDTLKSQQLAISNTVVTSQMNNVAGQVFDHLGGSFGGGGTDLQVSANGFAASTTGFANMLNGYQAAKAHPLASLDGDISTSGYSSPAWNAWIKGTWNIYDGDSFDGYTADVMAGLDYRYSDTTIIGMLGGYGVSDFDVVTSGTDGSFNGDSYSIGPYIGMKLSEHLQFDAMATYTYSDYASVSGTTDGNFNAHRATLAAQLTG